MTRRSLVICALTAGVAVGTTGAALSAAQDATAPRATASRQQTASPPPAPTPTPRDPSRLPDGRLDPGRVHRRILPGSDRVAVRVKDPDGGADWAIRSFAIQRYSIQRPQRTLKGAMRIGRNRCVQLGRIGPDGSYGWVAPDGRFGPTPYDSHDLEHCTGIKRPEPMIRMAIHLRLPSPDTPEPVRSVIWGLAPGAIRAELRDSGGADGAMSVGPGGEVIRLGPPGARRARAVVEVPGARPIALSRDRGYPAPPVGRPLTFPPLKPGTETIEARTPDPAGGPPHGLLVAEREGAPPCVAGSGRIVGDRIGSLNLALGLFEETVGTRSGCRPVEVAPDDERACDISTGFGSGEPTADSADPLLRRARIERRLLPGRSSITATCRDDVTAVVIQSPRDLRTLVPSPIGRAIHVLYDGDFGDGELRFTAKLRNGRTHTDTFPLSPF